MARSVVVQVMCRACRKPIKTRLRNHTTECASCGNRQYVPAGQQWEGPTDTVPENMRASLSRTVVELDCYHCGHVIHTRAKSGGTTRCPNCLRNRRIPSDARATSDPAWQRAATLAGRLADDPADPAALPPPPESGRYGAAERAASATMRRPRGKRRNHDQEAPAGHLHPDGHVYDVAPGARPRRQSRTPCGECGKRHRAGTDCLAPRETADVRAERLARERAERSAQQRADAERSATFYRGIQDAAMMLARIRGVDISAPVQAINARRSVADDDAEYESDYYASDYSESYSSAGKNIEYLPDTNGGRGVPVEYIDISGKR